MLIKLMKMVLGTYLKTDSCKTFNYRRYQDPESTAYVEINTETNYVEWIGYMNKKER